MSSRLVVMPALPRQLDLLADQRTKPATRAPNGVDFGVDAFALGDPDLRDEIIEDIANIPQPYRRRVLRALRQIAATPAIERLRIVDDIEAAGRRAG